MSMTSLVELVQKLEKAIDENDAGWQNTDARRSTQSMIWEIWNQLGTKEGYRAGEEGHEIRFDQGYVIEKLGSLNEEVDKLYSQRKHAMAGGVDGVKSQAMGDCARLRMYFGRAWIRTSDGRIQPPSGLN
jgi:hypothetical protein